MGRYRPLSWGDPWYMDHLFDSYQSCEKESGAEPRSPGTSLEQDKWTLSKGMKFWCTSISSFLWWKTRSRLEVRRSIPYQENGSASIYVSSHCYQCILLYWLQAISLWFGSPLLYRPHQVSGRFDSKLAGVENTFVMQQGRHIRWPSVDPCPLKKENRDRQIVLVTLKRRPMSTHWIVTNWHFWTIQTDVFAVLFPSVVRQMLGYNTQRRGTICILPT